VKVIGIAGHSGSGKTTLIEKVIPLLVAQELRVSLIKHAHHAFDVDKPGKDSWRHREAGCTEVLVSSAQRWALMHELRGAPEPALKETIHCLVRHHLRANQYEPSWTDSAVRRFARELGAHLDDLLCLARADITTKRPEKKRKGLSQINELAERISALAAEDAKQPPLPSGVGDAIMKAFALKPSRQIGDIKRALEAAIESGEVEPYQECEAYVAFVAADKPRFGL